MFKLTYAALGASVLVAVASLGSRVIDAQTLSGSSGSSSSSTSSGSGLNCSNAAPSRGVIWPPDHTMVSETITGVTGATSIVITGIQQNEPVEALGSGNTEPDGSGVGTSTAYVRAERAGPGTGRIYFIWYVASDGLGQCAGYVPVFVPHDLGQGFIPVNTTPRYDSTALVD